MIRVTLEIKGFDDVDYVRNEFMKEMKVFSDNVKISVEKICELTDDERVILRNLPVEFKYIHRGKDNRLIVSELTYNSEHSYFCENLIFNHLFQFIKERRRIFYRGTFERRYKNLIKRAKSQKVARKM